MAASIARVVTDVIKFSCCSSNKKIGICICVYLFATRATRLQLQKDAKKNCRKKWRGSLKESIERMFIRPPQSQFFEHGIKITATETKYYQVEN